MRRLFIIYAVLFSLFGTYLYYYQENEKALQRNAALPVSNTLNEKYVMVTFQAGIDYWKTAIKGFEDAASELNVSLEYRGATQFDVYEQITVLEQVIARKPAGIAISAVDTTKLNPTINQAVEAGIPVVLFDADAPESKAFSFLGTNNVEAGAEAAHKMASLMGEKGKVAVLTAPGQLNLKERTAGFVETIKKEYPNMKITAVEDGKRDQMTAKKVVSALLEKDPEIKGFFSTEANAGVGIAEAAKSLHKQIHIIGFDTDKQTLDLIKEGEIEATIAQDTWEMGYQSLQLLFQLQHSPDKKVPARINTGVTVVTNDNVKSYYAW